jgi:small subunit ribosomal protein S16
MATKIRFSRRGTTKRPFYWLVASDSRSPRDGNFIEKLGTYNPLLPKDNADRFSFKKERIEYWLSTGAQASDRALKLIQSTDIIVPAKKAIAKGSSKKLTPKAPKKKKEE